MKVTRHDTRLDPLVEHYAVRTQGLKVSAVRALFAVANRPEIVSLAGGMPNIKDLPLDEIGDHIARMICDHGTQVMQYGSGQGEPRIREQICELMAEEGSVADPDDIVITAGSQQGLDLVTRIFCDPGDVILAESPSYVGALGTFQSYQTEVVHIACDSEGLIPEAVTETAERLKKQGRRVKFLYTIPNFNNPSGVTQSLERRHRIIESCAAAGVLVVEDNPYGLLALDSDPLPAMRSLNANVVYLGSFSKTFAPGFRVGWVCAPHGVKERLVLAQESATLCPPVFSQFAISNYLENCDWRDQIESFRNMYRSRRDAMLPRGIRTGSCVLRRRAGFPQCATVLLFPAAGPDRDGSGALRPRGAGRAGDAANLRHAHPVARQPGQGTRTESELTAPRLTRVKD